MRWDLFLMKKLLKSEICESREQCTGPLVLLKSQISRPKKEKEKGNADTGRANAQSKGCLKISNLYGDFLLKVC